MVTVAQLVEPRTVTPVVVGSSPISHPIIPQTHWASFGRFFGTPAVWKWRYGNGGMEIKELSTLDGRRTELCDLNLGSVPVQDESVGYRGRLASVLHGMSLTLAGMYTGLTCYGTPNPIHKSQPERRVSTERDRWPV
jgi:hypothetical protein